MQAAADQAHPFGADLIGRDSALLKFTPAN
jgi:hypothetical protein